MSSSDSQSDSDTGSDSDSGDAEESVRKAVERSQSGAPAAGAVVRDRFETNEVFQRILADADHEIDVGMRELFFSALAAGFSITLTFLLYSTMTESTGGHPVTSAILYPLGFVFIILGRYQLFTENTLPPVALVLERLASVPALLRVWIVVLVANFLGGGIGAYVLANTGVFTPATTAVATDIALKGIQTPFWDLFFKAVFAGLIVAGVVWIDFAARDTVSRLVIIYMGLLAVPYGNLFHVVVSFTEMMFLFFNGDVGFVVGISEFILPVLLGNTVGGVVLVTLLNYFQATQRRVEAARGEGLESQLSIKEVLLGGLVGRSYISPDNGDSD